VDSVRACTEAFDTYRFPQPADPKPLYTFGGGGFQSFLNVDCLLADFYKMNEAQWNLTYLPQDVVPSPEDLNADFYQYEPLLPTITSILNSPGWMLFASPLPPVGDFLPEDDHISPAWVQFDSSSAATSYPFITLDNLTPLPGPVSGPTNYYVSPVETLGLVEALSPVRSLLMSLGEILSQAEELTMTP
jgi:hypothetical protein